MGPFKEFPARGVEDGVPDGLVLPVVFRFGPVTVSGEGCPGIRSGFQITGKHMNPRPVFSAKSVDRSVAGRGVP